MKLGLFYGVVGSLILLGMAGCQTARPAADNGGTQPPHSAAASPAALLPGLGNLHHPVTTQNRDAQRFFDQGLTLAYAFNHDEAIRSFQRAGELDGKLAMAWWGVAMALGPNYNVDVDPPREKAAFEAIQKALKLSAGASAPERAYIEALSRRYSNDPRADLHKLAADYSNAMRDVALRYPDDLDAATLFAESAMDLRPWKLWSADHKPAEGTLEIVETLESVLRRDPNHIGALHLYIHAIEGSDQPERGLQAADTLPRLCPGAGHLVHMPAHIYARTGDYVAAAGSNDAAVTVDRAYIKATGAQGIYPMLYYSHNLHFLAYADAEAGDFAGAMKAAGSLVAHVSPHVRDMPMLEGFMPAPTLILLRFHRWEDVLKQPKPDAKLAIANAVWHVARGMAYAAKGDIPAAERERQAFEKLRKSIPADAMYGMLNKVANVFAVAADVLDAQIAIANKDTPSAMQHLNSAIRAEDALNYAEPPDWLSPAREMLGGLLLREGNAAQAENVFRADLEKNPRSGRSLFGLHQSLREQKKLWEADAWVLPRFKEAWKQADTTLKVEDL